jgi:outer membrane receptor protein involved in Fe transport
MRVVRFSSGVLRFAAVVVAANYLPSPPAGAQTASDSSGPPAPSRDEVVVTATRFSTTLQKTPLSMDALSSGTLELTNVKSFNDFEMQVPGLSAQDVGPGDKRYAIRNIQAPGEPQVGLYFDEIPIAGLVGESNNDTGNAQPDLNLFDVERIEILKGPQGTLFGEGSMGGTIRVISKRPNLTDYESEVQANVASVNHGGVNKDGDAMLNVPLIQDWLAVRLVGYYRDDPGYIKEVLQNQSGTNTLIDSGGRLSVRGKMADNWVVDLIAYADDTHQANTFQEIPYFGEWSRYSFILQPRRDTFHGYNLISTTDFPFATLTVLASYQDRKIQQIIDLTPSLISILSSNGGPPLCNVINYATCLNNVAPFAFFLFPTADLNRQSEHARSAEVRLQSPATSLVKWTIGGFFQKRDNFNETLVNAGPASPQVAIDPTTCTGQAGCVLVNNVFGRENWDPLQQDAIFGEVTYPLTKTIDLTAGWRYSHGQRSDQYQQIQNFGDATPFCSPVSPPTVQPPTCVATGLAPKNYYSQDANTPKAELSYHPDDNNLYYVMAAKGFRLGGPNVPQSLDRSFIPPPFYSADSLWDYELGYKGSFLRKRVTVDGGLFYMDWSHVQQTASDNTGAFQFTQNGGSAVAKGLEFEVTAKATSNLELAGGFNFTRANLSGAQPIQPQAQNVVVSGDRFPYVPDWTADGSATYRFPLGLYKGYLRAEAFYRSGQTTAFDTVSPLYAQLPAYWLANIRGGLDFGSFSAQLYVTNVADKNTQIGGFPLGSGQLLQVTSTPPRTIGLLLTAKLF